MSTRHRVRHTRLGKASGHSKANLRNLVNQLIEHERIVTTEARGRAMRREAERMVTKAKRGLAAGGNRVHAYRLLMSRLNQTARRWNGCSKRWPRAMPSATAGTRA